MSKKIYLQSAFAYREDTLENWLFYNPILEKGEVSIVRDGADGEWLKIGDGVTRWVNLPYKKGPRGDAGPIGPQGPAGDDYVLTQADKEEIANMAKPEIDQTYNPESENAQSGIAVAEAIKWKTLIDTTLTAEQAGTSTVYIEIPNWEQLKTISQMQICVDIVTQNDITAQTFECAIRNNGGGVYNSSLCWSQISASTAGTTYYYRALVSLFKTRNTGRDYLCLYSTPHKYTGAYGATNAAKILGTLQFKNMPTYPPHLNLRLQGDGLFAEGTKIRLEVM